jgi:hypothetical protein
VSDLARARLSVRFFLDRLKDQISALRSQQFPGSQQGPYLWLRLASGILDTAEGYLDRSEKTSEDDAIKLTKNAAELCSVAYDHLGHLSGATSDLVPWSVVDPLNEWFTQLGISNTVIFRAELKRNYEIKPFNESEFQRFRDPSPSLSKAIKDVRWPILRVTVPSAALSILPHFAIVAHEVGHRVSIPYDVRPIQPIINAAAARVTTSLRAFDSQTGTDFQGVVYRWIAEFTSDAVALYLTGPASFFSLDFTQLAAMGHHGIGPTHPAHRLRRAVLFHQLTSESPSFADIFEKYTEVTLTEDLGSSLLPIVPDKATLSKEISLRTRSNRMAAVISELNESAPDLAHEIYRQVHDHLATTAPTHQYTIAQFDNDLKNHLEAITFTIPPIETGDVLGQHSPCGLASILNIGWAAVLTKVDKIIVRSDPEHPHTGNLITIHNLLLKAVELSEAKRRWEAAK